MFKKRNYEENPTQEPHKWKQKEESVYQEIAKGKYKQYYMITPKTWVYSLNKIKELTK